eukprot:TRINITY_DN5640_c0_g1_i4.p1 TRINITY_DN5640_c0_g1~~TRINITY_DN5640_c0_g1_i4.p1  ORF type:complete len:227 (+),score=26.45 TRINITY_DN5640_c0_g1_i4:100-780(+)
MAFRARRCVCCALGLMPLIGLAARPGDLGLEFGNLMQTEMRSEAAATDAPQRHSARSGKEIIIDDKARQGERASMFYSILSSVTHRQAVDECVETDEHGYGLGCKSTSCGCSVFQTCYPKFSPHKENGPPVDIGVCGKKVWVMATESIIIFLLSLIILMVTRSILQWREKVSQTVEDSDVTVGFTVVALHYASRGSRLGSRCSDLWTCKYVRKFESSLFLPSCSPC